MSWVKVIICDTCNTILGWGEDEYTKKCQTGYLHTCKECQIKEWGFFLGDDEREDILDGS